MRASLVSLDYEVPNCDTSLRDLPVTIGRSPDADICLNDPSVALYHCRIEQVGDQLLVYDLGSAHGTAVNGDRIRESPLLPGDSLSVGLRSFFVRCLDDGGRPMTCSRQQAAGAERE